MKIRWSAILILLVSISCTTKNKEEGKQSIIPDSVYLEKGDKLIAITFDTLRNSLLATIGEQGIPYAIQFCNEKAYPLTTMYADEGITIRRASSRYRNPRNQPDSLEQAVLNDFVTNGPSTKIIRTDRQVHYIKPILLQAMCLNCHGTPGVNIKPETLQAIQQHYPADQAINFAEGDLRGIWHIAFSLKP